MTSRFDHFLAIDWSGAKGKRHKGIALAICDAAGGAPVLVDPGAGWSREDVLTVLQDLPPDTLVGMDLGIALPFADCDAYFPGLEDGPQDAKALWTFIDRLCRDDEDLAANSFVDHPRLAPYYRRQGLAEGAMFRCDNADHGRGRFRAAEHAQAAMGLKPYSNLNLVGAAQVGKSSLTGMRLLHRLGGRVPVWPIDPLPPDGSVITEIYTTLAAMQAGRSPARAKMRDYSELNDALGVIGSPPAQGSGPIDDHSADALITAAWLRSAAQRPENWEPAGLTPKIAQTEGWTFGAI